MEVKNFIKAQLQTLSAAFPQLTIKYAYNEKIETHVVELTPQTEYDHNESLDDAWMQIAVQFMELFPMESICFISNDSSLAISRPEFTFTQKEAALQATSLDNIYKQIVQDVINNTAFEFDLDSLCSFFTITSTDIGSNVGISSSKVSNKGETVIESVTTVAETTGIENAAEMLIGNTQYAMAA